jgi:hypothetical protein
MPKFTLGHPKIKIINHNTLISNGHFLLPSCGAQNRNDIET